MNMPEQNIHVFFGASLERCQGASHFLQRDVVVKGIEAKQAGDPETHSAAVCRTVNAICASSVPWWVQFCMLGNRVCDMLLIICCNGQFM